MAGIYIINITITLLFVLCSAYQLVYLAIPFIIKEKPHKRATPHSFTILIAARNEEAVIGQLLDSIAAQDYPSELIRVCVTADNCSDSTADIALSKGAVVFERSNKEKVGKGYVLQFMLDKLKENNIESDVYLVLDADNVIETDYVKEMNQSISDGFSIVTGYRNTKNFGDNWISAGYGLWFLRESQFVNRARHRLQTSCMVMGTGFCFTHEIAQSLGGWGYFSMTEDTDFSMDMICKGERIGYCERAILYDEQPVKFSQSWRQRLRWIRGSFENFTKHGKGLLCGIFKGSWSCYDALAANLSAFVVIMVAGFANVVNSALRLINGDSLLPVLQCIVPSVISGYLCLFLMGAVTAFSEWKNIRASSARKLFSIFTYPIYIFTNLPIAICALFAKAEWKPIIHTRSMDLEDVKKGKRK